MRHTLPSTTRKWLSIREHHLPTTRHHRSDKHRTKYSIRVKPYTWNQTWMSNRDDIQILIKLNSPQCWDGHPVVTPYLEGFLWDRKHFIYILEARKIMQTDTTVVRSIMLTDTTWEGRGWRVRSISLTDTTKHNHTYNTELF